MPKHTCGIKFYRGWVGREEEEEKAVEEEEEEEKSHEEDSEEEEEEVYPKRVQRCMMDEGG